MCDKDDDEPEYSRADYESDQADNKIKQMKESGEYEAWRRSNLPYGEFVRRQYEDEYERAKAAHARRLAEERRWDREDTWSSR